MVRETAITLIDELIATGPGVDFVSTFAFPLPATIIFTLLGVALVVSMAGFAALYFLVGRAPAVPSNATLTLELGGDLAEVSPADVVSYVRGVRAPTVRSIVDNLRKAKVDPRVSAVLLKPTGFDTPFWGKIDEIRDAVLDFKKSGKPIYAYLEYGGDRDYYLASAADKVFLMPSSPLDLTGVATYELFLRGTLDKIGAVPDLHHIGDYKTASNTFTEKTFTAAHREMDASLNRALYDQIVRGVAEGRKKTAEEVQRLIDQGPFLPEAALQAGLVDEVVYEDQVTDRLRALTQSSRDIEGDDYSGISTTSLGLDRGPRIAVIYATGTINSGRSGYDPLNGAIVGSETLIEYIRQARRDDSIRAIVVRIAQRVGGGRTWVRSCNEHLGLMLRRGVATGKSFVIGSLGASVERLARQHGVPTNSGFSGVYDFEKETRTFGTLCARFLMRQRDNGLMMCHPGHSDTELAQIDSLTDRREVELAYFKSDAWPEALRRHNLEIGPLRRA